VTNRAPATQPDTNDPADARHDAASAAPARADDARERARAARRAAEQAIPEYARRSNHRTADLHAELAASHEDFARRVRFGDGRQGA
jgi:hypothetical protein